MQTVIEDILVNCDLEGRDKNGTVLILHGWGQNLGHWKYISERLSKKYKVVTLDLPGFGSTTSPAKIYKIFDYSNFVKNFVDKLKLGKIILIGHSFGGKIAIKLAADGLYIDRLFLISPSGTSVTPPLITFKIGLYKLIKVLLFWLPNKSKASISELFSSEDYKNAGNMKETFRITVKEKVDEDAEKINIPTYIFWGEKDGEVNVKNSKKLKALIKNSTLRILWGVGHSPNLESPEKITDLLFEYL